MQTWWQMTVPDSKEPTAGTLESLGVEATPIGDSRTLYKLTSNGKQYSVVVKHDDPDYRPSREWLISQAKHSEDAGNFTSDKNQERILQLVEELRSFNYDRYSTPREYAQKWGISVSYVRMLCAEARRLVREELEDEDYAKSTVLEALDRVIRGNINKPGPGYQNLVIKAAKVYAEIVGVKAPLEMRLSRGDDLPSDPVKLAQLADQLSRKVLGSGYELDSTQTDHSAVDGEVVDSSE